MRKCVKRIASALTACVATCAFYGCMDVSKYYYTYDYETYKTQAVSVELMDYTPEKVDYYITSKKCAYETFETDKATLIETLPQEEIQGFLYDLSVQTVYMPLQENRTVKLTNPCGKIARITYADGSFHTISYCKLADLVDVHEDFRIMQAFTYYNANGEVLESRWLSGEYWYTFVVTNCFSEKIYPLQCDVTVHME